MHDARERENTVNTCVLCACSMPHIHNAGLVLNSNLWIYFHWYWLLAQLNAPLTINNPINNHINFKISSRPQATHKNKPETSKPLGYIYMYNIVVCVVCSSVCGAKYSAASALCTRA